MFTLLLTHQLWPTSLGQNHMLALLLTHQLWPTSGDVRVRLALEEKRGGGGAGQSESKVGRWSALCTLSSVLCQKLPN